MNVYLIGFMASGKTSLGKKIAGKLDRTFIDLDQKIEEKEGISITQIFKEKGETHFRKLEQDVLFSLPSQMAAVISLGGGTPCHDLNWSFLDQNGLIIYLKEEEATLLGRLRQNRSDRPLIANLSDAELKTFVHEKLNERSTYYERAHFTFEKDKTSLDFLINQIQAFLGEQI